MPVKHPGWLCLNWPSNWPANFRYMAIPQSFVQEVRTNVPHIFAIGDLVG